MSTVAQLLEQRAYGEARLVVGAAGLARLREAGACKLRWLRADNEAILINTGGGLASAGTTLSPLPPMISIRRRMRLS